MNSKSYLHSEWVLVLLGFLFLCEIGLAQINNSETDISELKRQLQIFNEKKDIASCLSLLVKILSLDPNDYQAQKQLKLVFKYHFDKISADEELINSCVRLIKDPCSLPLLDLTIHYMNNSNIYMVQTYLEKIQFCGYSVTDKLLLNLLRLYSSLSPELQLNFFSIINEKSDSLIKIYSAYMAYQAFANPKIGISGICKTIGIKMDKLKDYFIPRIDSVTIFLSENLLNFDIRIFNHFIYSLNHDNEKEIDEVTFQKIKNLKNELFLHYIDNDVGYLENFISEYKNEGLPWKFSYEDIKKFTSISPNLYYLPLLKIISQNYYLTEDNNVKYDVGKLFFENGLIDESKNVLSTLDFNLKKKIKNSELLPLIFSSYLLNKDSLFKDLSKDFLLNGDEEDFRKLKEELIWWSNNKIKIDFLEKGLALFSNQNYEVEVHSNPILVDTFNREQSNYYALLIAIQDYDDDNLDLKYPIKDALELKRLLVDLYSFDEGNIITLFNPQRSEIIKSFLTLKSKLNSSDNLLVFYAGHGNWDEIAEQGYWLPADSKPNDLSQVITNTEITAYIKAIKSKHTLLISDACFSGSIFKTRDAFLGESYDIDYYQSRTARKAITSGALTPVPDKSIFIYYLLKALRENKKSHLTSEELFLNFREAVINNSPLNQRPLFGNINDTGDEGGDFVFIKK